MKKIIATFALCCFATTAAMAADDIHKKFEGKWEWNKSASKYQDNDASDPFPTSMSFTILKADGKTYSDEGTVVMPDGKSSNSQLTAKNDGQYYPDKGSDEHEQDIVTQAADGTLSYDFKNDKGTGTVNCLLSSDGNTNTCAVSEKRKDKTISSTMVFNRK